MSKTSRLKTVKSLEVVRFGLLGLLMFAFLFPFYWLLKTSLEPTSHIHGNNYIVPRAITFEHYVDVWDIGFVDSVVTSLVTGIGTMVLTTAVALLGAYAITRFIFPGRNKAAKLVLIAYMFPNTAIIVPMFHMASSVGLLNNPIILVLLHSMIALPFCLWILQSYLESIPIELEEAAWVEGASRVRTLREIIIPQAMPAIIAVAVLAFIMSWGEYMFATVLVTDRSHATVPVMVTQLLGGYQMQWGRVAAASVVAVLPVLALFWLMVKYLGQGIARGTGVIE